MQTTTRGKRQNMAWKSIPYKMLKKTKKKSKTPFLRQPRRGGERMRNAFETADDFIKKETKLLAIGENGVPTEQIRIDADYYDAQAYWTRHEAKLWAVVVCSALYFAMVLFG